MAVIVLLSCSIGGIDDIRIMPTQTVGVTAYYTDNSLPYPLPNLNNRLKGKYVKINTHRFMEQGIFVWIDGSIEILTPDYVEHQINLLGDADVLVCKHPARATIGEELRFILDQINKADGSPHSNYIISRYGNEPIQEELDWIIAQGAENLPLYAGGIFTRRNTSKINRAFEDWFTLCLEFANFDQCLFSYILNKHQLKIVTQDYHSDLRRFHNHLF